MPAVWDLPSSWRYRDLLLGYLGLFLVSRISQASPIESHSISLCGISHMNHFLGSLRLYGDVSLGGGSGDNFNSLHSLL